MTEFLTQNPGYEVASLDVTAAYGDTTHGAAVAAKGAVSDAEQDLRNRDTARRTARVTILGGMRGLIKNLEAKLSAHDPRWMAFGLAMPASRVTPAKPTGLVVSLNGTDGLLATCIAPSQATRFHWRMRQVGPGYVFRWPQARLSRWR